MRCRKEYFMTEECLDRIPRYSTSKEDLYFGHATGLKKQAMTYELIEQGVIPMMTVKPVKAEVTKNYNAFR